MHVPVVHSKPFAGRSGRGPLGDSLMELDAAAGRVLQALDKAGVTNDTLVVLTGDNGQWVSRWMSGCIYVCIHVCIAGWVSE